MVSFPRKKLPQSGESIVALISLSSLEKKKCGSILMYFYKKLSISISLNSSGISSFSKQLFIVSLFKEYPSLLQWMQIVSLFKSAQLQQIEEK